MVGCCRPSADVSRNAVTALSDGGLLDWLAERLAWPSARAVVERIGEGHSREMLIVRPEGASPVVVRIEQGGVFGTTSVEERRVMRVLKSRGIAVAGILADDPGPAIGRPFFVMEFVDGVEHPIPTTAFVDRLHALHRLPVDDEIRAAFDRSPLTARDATLGQIDRWYDVYRASVTDEIAGLERAAEWLRENTPDDGRLAVVHGDAGPGNFVHDGVDVRAFTDWEFAHLGDPREDWSFCVSMRGPRVLGQAEWMSLIAERTGVRFDDESWRYWVAFNLFKGACANLTCRHLYETGRNPAPNMAIVGTAVHRLFVQRLVGLISD